MHILKHKDRLFHQLALLGAYILGGIAVTYILLVLGNADLPWKPSIQVTKQPLLTAEDKTKTGLLSSPLHIGQSGREVLLLQVLLYQNKTIYSGPLSGYFGVLTENAVKQFQHEYALEESGQIDKLTNEMLFKLYGDKTKEFWLSLVPSPTPLSSTTTQDNTSGGQWGVAQRVAGTEYGWNIKIGMDTTMATPQEIFDALNRYRSVKGVHGLNWDSKLAKLAQDRSDYLNSIGKTDDHVGFKNYVDNPDNRKYLGFAGIGENASYGYRLNGTHIIEFMYASDPGHDGNQLNSNWTDVGVGVSGTATSVVFGYDRF